MVNSGVLTDEEMTKVRVNWDELIECNSNMLKYAICDQIKRTPLIRASFPHMYISDVLPFLIIVYTPSLGPHASPTTT